MADVSGKSKTVKVAFRAYRGGEQFGADIRRTSVELIEGYTTEDDIAGMIAMALGADRVVVLAIKE